jgi:cytochrome c
MHTLTRIHAAAYSIMLASAGALSVPVTAYAQGDAAAGEKVFAHCVPCHVSLRWRPPCLVLLIDL